MLIKKENEKVVVGGTFDFFHKGHESFLNKAFSLGRVFIGLTSDRMALKTKKRKVQSFEEREKELKNFIENNFEFSYSKPKGLIYGTSVPYSKSNLIYGTSVPYRIGKIEDKFGPTLKEDFDYIVVSPETYKTAVLINQERQKINKKPIEIIEIEFILAEDGKPISSARIFKGEIDKEGRLLK